jgi:phosphate acetyltransferase
MHSFYLAPTVSGTGLTSVSLGLVRGFDQLGVRAAYFKPIARIGDAYDPHHAHKEHPHQLIRETVGRVPVKPLSLAYAQQRMAQGHADRLMEEIITAFQLAAENVDVVVVEGLDAFADETFIDDLNVLVAKTLNSDIILVAAPRHFSDSECNQRIEMAASLFASENHSKLLGCILNKVGAPVDAHQSLLLGAEVDATPISPLNEQDLKTRFPIFSRPSFLCLGVIPWQRALVAPRTLDVVDYLQATPLSTTADAHQLSCARRVLSVVVIGSTLVNMLHTLRAGVLIITPGDRDDVLLAASLAVLNGVPLAGVIFTGGYQPDQRALALCANAIHSGLPIFTLSASTLVATQALMSMTSDVPDDDVARLSAVMESVAQGIDLDILRERTSLAEELRLSPPAFRHLLVQRARAANKRIVLPEGEEPRTIQAACICAERQIARCMLLGRAPEIQRIAATLGLEIPPAVTIIDPIQVRKQYIPAMVALRSHKGMTEAVAEALLDDNVYLGTMMLAQNEVDGLVSGAIHTTANTIRPALQLIKTKADARLVSSVFFMLLPDQVLVYGDCAVNPNPNAEELADIALQAHDSARAFGIEPRIAMISYSTGESGVGEDVDKVREATRIAHQKRPDIVIDGPLQYDAAAIPSVAATKAPNSPVAGRATVFIFPDLNTGNTTYKAVQRSANVLSVGPVLQGLKKPVNDLSRGALVEDIVFTIAITAIQAEHKDP